MTTKTKLVVGGVVLAGAAAAWWFLRGRGLTCGAGYTFKRWTPEQLAGLSKWSAAVQDQVRRYGGTCVRAGAVDFVGTLPSEGGPILYPWQVE